MNATDARNRDEAVRNDAVLAREIEWFTNRWQPDNVGDRARFSADLAVIVRRAAIEANAEIIKHYASLAALAGPAPMVFPFTPESRK